MNRISKTDILFEKVSGNYSCPHYIPPQIADTIAKSMDIQLDLEASKALAEIAENFALEVLKQCRSKKPSKSEIREIVELSELS